MVCSDPGLAAADREMARAYRRAIDAGMDPADLRQEQQDWRAVREVAARQSRRSVAEIYDQRIHELDRMATDAAASEAGANAAAPRGPAAKNASADDDDDDDE
jgi:uncharacterized protein